MRRPSTWSTRSPRSARRAVRCPTRGMAAPPSSCSPITGGGYPRTPSATSLTGPRKRPGSASAPDATVRTEYERALTLAKQRLGTLPEGRTALPLAGITNGGWKDSPVIKSRLAGGFCLRAPAQGACAYANICEHCPNFRTDATYLPVLAAQRTDAQALAEDAEARGWITEATRHRDLLARLDTLISKAQAG